MTYQSFRADIIDNLPRVLRHRHRDEVEHVVDELVRDFDAGDISGLLERKNRNLGVPWVLLVEILIQILKWWWLKHGAQDDMKAYQSQLRVES